MKKITLSIIVMFLLGNIFAQNETTKRYPFKKATITYKLSGDYEGTRTVYIDDFGAKQADYWKGSYEKRQPGPNERVDFEFHDIFIGKLKYQINDGDHNALISSNPYYFYAENASDINTANAAILSSELFKKTGRIEQVSDEQCVVWKQKVRFLIEIDNYIWVNDKNIVTKYEFGFLKQLQIVGSIGTAIIEKIDFDSEVPASVFSAFPEYTVYQYMETADQEGNSFDDKVFASDELKQKFKDDIKLKAFVPNRDMNKEAFKKNVQAFSDSYIGSTVYPGFSDNNGYINSQFQIQENTDSTKEVVVVIDIRNRNNLDKIYLDDYERSFNDFTTEIFNKIDIDGRKAIYISGTKDETDSLSIIILNDKGKYCIKFEVYDKYSQEEMVEMLKQTKILDL